MKLRKVSEDCSFHADAFSLFACRSLLSQPIIRKHDISEHTTAFQKHGSCVSCNPSVRPQSDVTLSASCLTPSQAEEMYRDIVL